MTDLANEIKSLLADPFPDVGLTPREADVIRLGARGMTFGTVGERLSIEENTANQYAIRACRKIGVSWRELPAELIKRIEKALRRYS
jgi:DNA-binding CsgD family transcriptional regulator